MKHRFLIYLVLALTAVLAACAGQPQAAARPEPVRYTVNMTEFAFAPAELQAKVGQEVTIELVNDGYLDHEFMVGREVKVTDSRPDGYVHDLFEEAKPVVAGGMMSEEEQMGGHGDAHSGFMVTVAKEGEPATITFTPTEEMVGEWEIGCFAQEGVHYDAGMKGKLVITQ